VLSKYFLHESISMLRWTGVLLIAGGVGLVTRGPSLTEPQLEPALVEQEVL
jgi:drug/metabolite transporter (DMT)-like permease